LKIRSYPHFDGALTEQEGFALVHDPKAVTEHPFFPFIQYTERWTKFAVRGAKGVEKSRPIMYAARRDSAIYSQYREILSFAYEQVLLQRGISENVLAYRRISKGTSLGNKCNIHFANDVFSKISELGSCQVYTLDIRKFFETIDHAKLKDVWIKLLGCKKLPSDHFKVFQNITRYASVDRDQLYRKLGFIGRKKLPNGRTAVGYLIKKVPLQVCSSKIFREKLAPLISVNSLTHGIPQGAPISDILANLYLLDFDTQLSAALKKEGGVYYRYSDDILIVIPDITDDYNLRLQTVQKLLTEHGDKLEVQPNKSTVHRFTKDIESGVQSCTSLYGKNGKNGLEYLGFRFDGSRVYLRDSTRSRLQRKMTVVVSSVARIHCIKNKGKSPSELKKLFRSDLLLQRFWKIKDFDSVASEYESWTFWTYAIRAQQVFGERGLSIAKQLRNFKRSIKDKSAKAIDKYALP
jgi:Reverse transcriptase (RNA-dependent DNA polymerase)